MFIWWYDLEESHQGNSGKSKTVADIDEETFQNTVGCIPESTYVGRVHPVLIRGMAATSTASKTTAGKNSKFQNQAMRMMTGATKTTPIRELETIAGHPTLENR